MSSDRIQATHSIKKYGFTLTITSLYAKLWCQYGQSADFVI